MSNTTKARALRAFVSLTPQSAVLHQFGAIAFTANVVSPRPPVTHSPLNTSTPRPLRWYLLWSALSLWSLCQYAAAQPVYKVTDENGNVTFY
jgi:hypothetical protein